MDSQTADGLLYFVSFSSLSYNVTEPNEAYTFLEGCWAWGDRSSTPGDAKLMTSGGEVKPFLARTYLLPTISAACVRLICKWDIFCLLELRVLYVEYYIDMQIWDHASA